MVFRTSLFLRAVSAGARIQRHIPQVASNGGNKLMFPTFGDLHLPSAMSFRSYIHSGNPVNFEARDGRGSVDFIKGLLQDDRNFVRGRSFNAPGPFQGYRNDSGAFGYPNQTPLETNADIVHIKLKRNNAFVTVTDSKGNKKAGISAGAFRAKGAKKARYSAQGAAEHIGAEVRKMGTRSVVVKVNGFTYFKKKKDAILGLKDGYTNSRPEGNPIVYIEDTTRKPHNGCRRRKQRRV